MNNKFQSLFQPTKVTLSGSRKSGYIKTIIGDHIETALEPFRAENEKMNKAQGSKKLDDTTKFRTKPNQFPLADILRLTARRVLSALVQFMSGQVQVKKWLQKFNIKSVEYFYECGNLLTMHHMLCECKITEEYRQGLRDASSGQEKG
jgi:hypothetical protein